jgi:glycosyltransferase involved in cell wall biosynthesis
MVRVRAWHWPERAFGIAYPLFAPSLCWRLWHEVGRAEVVHAHGLVFPGSPWATAFARVRGRWSICTDHGGLLRYRARISTLVLRLLFATLGRVTARTANRLIAYNRDVELLLQRLSGDASKVRFLPNPVDAALFRPPTAAERAAARTALGWDDTPRVLCIARLLPHKGIDVLLAAQDPAWRVVFCGPGDDLMRDHIAARGGECLPPRPQEDLRALYHAADVFALPSYNEGFPVAVQEALACGLPVITSDLPAYAPYRGRPGLHLCQPVAEQVRERVRAVLAAPRPPVAAPAAGADADAGRWLATLMPPPAERPAPRPALGVTLLLLLGLHFAFCAVRWPVGAVGKRAGSIAEFEQLGAVDWHLRHSDEETRRIAGWLVASVAADERVLCRGSAQGALQLLAPLLHPRLLTDAERFAANGPGSASWRPFAGAASAARGMPVVVGDLQRLRLEWR